MDTSPPVTFAAERLDIIAEGEAGHFWYGPRRALLLDTLARAAAPGARIVDIGCGTGGLVQALRERGHDAVGVDPWAVRSGLDPRRFSVGQAETIPLPDTSVAVACAFDVIEHADDALALRELHRILVPGGRLLLSVPAHRWLWSTRDVLAGHRRRYTRAMLRDRVRAAGFEVDRIFGYQLLLLPLLVASRAWSRLRGGTDTHSEDAPSPVANALLRAINRLEVAFGRWQRPPTGSSLVLVATKSSRAASDRAASRHGVG